MNAEEQAAVIRVLLERLKRTEAELAMVEAERDEAQIALHKAQGRSALAVRYLATLIEAWAHPDQLNPEAVHERLVCVQEVISRSLPHWTEERPPEPRDAERHWEDAA